MVEIFRNICIFAIGIQMLLLFKAGKKYQVILKVISELIILVYIMNCFGTYTNDLIDAAQTSMNKFETAQEFILNTAQNQETKKVKSKINLETNKIEVSINQIKVQTEQIKIGR